MSRHGYVDDFDDDGKGGLWRGRVASAIRGKRGQAMLVRLRDALDAMPVRELVAGVLQTKDGDCCAAGCLAKSMGHDLTHAENWDVYELSEFNTTLAEMFNVSECLLKEIEYINDEGGYCPTPEARWKIVRAWVEKQIKNGSEK